LEHGGILIVVVIGLVILHTRKSLSWWHFRVNISQFARSALSLRAGQK
jgi:hypothetical protein